MPIYLLLKTHTYICYANTRTRQIKSVIIIVQKTSPVCDLPNKNVLKFDLCWLQHLIYSLS